MASLSRLRKQALRHRAAHAGIPGARQLSDNDIQRLPEDIQRQIADCRRRIGDNTSVFVKPDGGISILPAPGSRVNTFSALTNNAEA